MGTSFIQEMLTRSVASDVGASVGAAVTRTPVPQRPTAGLDRPSPEGFSQTPLPSYRPSGGDSGASTGTTVDVPSDGGATEDRGPSAGFGYDYSFDIKPIIGGPQYRRGVAPTAEPEFGTSYVGYLVDKQYGSKKYYDPVTGQIKEDMPGALSLALPGTLGAVAGFGASISKANLERIAKNAYLDKDGYAVATLGGRTIGVSPGLFGGYVLSGVLPEGITDAQRRQITEELLKISKTPEASGAYTGPDPVAAPGQTVAETESGAGQFTGSGDDGGYQEVSAPVSVSSPSISYTTDPGQEQEQRYSTSDYSFEDRRGMAEGGAAVQQTGFVEGSPDNFSKSQTVADDVFTQVREGSFVINAPATEKLQKMGVLPTGVDNSNKSDTIKASKGGMMDVALSKGEYVLEPEEAQKIGYSSLNKINNAGKPEVDRRQAASEGGFINGYRDGGTPLPQSSPFRTSEIDVIDQPYGGLTQLSSLYSEYESKFPSVKEARQTTERMIDQLPAEDVLALAMIGESSVLGDEGMKATAHVIVNRADSNYRDFAKLADIKDVVKTKTRKGSFQYNVFEPTKFRAALKSVTQSEYGRNKYRKVRDMAESILLGGEEDNTKGALFFWNPEKSTDSYFKRQVDSGEWVPTYTSKGKSSSHQYLIPKDLLN